MRLQKIGFIALPAVLLSLSSCLGNDDISKNDYAEWRQSNFDYIEKAEAATINGQKQYEKVIPDWDKSIFTLIQWHNDRSLTAKNLSPLSNSTCNVKYTLTNIEGDTLDTSSTQTEHGDSIFQCRPNNMITGFSVALTSMHIGDSVTAVIPYNAGYGTSGYNSILPYSTLIFSIKLVDIPAFESSSPRQ